MKLVAISDTHNLHYNFFYDIPDGDVIIHAGDFTTHGRIEEVNAFIKWFSRLPHEHKICIAGNHDRCMEDMLFLEDDFENAGITYLKNTGTSINNIKFYGSPYTPRFGNFAFMYNRENADTIWDRVPDDTEILITHGPPRGILDLCPQGNQGCDELLAKTQELSKLKYHIFGHIHEGYGVDGKYVNASNHPMLWDGSKIRTEFSDKTFKPIELEC